MTDDELQRLLRSTFSRSGDQAPSRDLWPFVMAQIRAPMKWSRFDIGLAAIITIVLTMFPEWLLLLAYHL